MYTIICLSGAKKDLKKLPNLVKIKVEDIFVELSKDPYKGEKLRGDLSPYFSFHLKINNVQYRIIYQVFHEKLVIAVVMVGSRENIYKDLKKRIR